MQELINVRGCPKSRVEVIARSETTKQSFVFNSKFRSLRSTRDDKITFWTVLIKTAQKRDSESSSE